MVIDLVLLPLFSSCESPTASFTLGTSLSSSLKASTIRVSLSLIITISSTCKFRLGRFHYLRSCSEWRNFFFHRDQNSFARCCTRLHCFLEYRSAVWKTPGGGKIALLFMELMFSAVRGRLFTIASASHMNVLSVSSLSCVPFFSRIADKIFRTVLICRSQTPPMWQADGTLNRISTQSQFSFSISICTWFWSISEIASRSSLSQFYWCPGRFEVALLVHVCR